MNLEAHLNELAVPEAADFRAVVARLRAAPERLPSADLTDRILAAVDAERARGRRGFRSPAPWWGAAAAAAAIAALTCLYLDLERQPLEPSDSFASSAAWLAANQEPDGTWSPARHGGEEAYRPALTALSALALDRAGHADQARLACSALAKLQTQDGSFGGNGRPQLYNHAITTYALATLAPKQPALKPALERAVGFIRARQTAEGGWDYEAGSDGNAAITSWQVRALACAADQGVEAANMPLRKGLRWLRGATRDDGSVAYHRGSGARSESLTALAACALITAGKPFPGLAALGQHAAGALPADTGAKAGADCYRDYAKVQAFEAAGAQSQADAVRWQMLKRQKVGSQDQWQKVGGTLYTTAFTALASK